MRVSTLGARAATHSLLTLAGCGGGGACSCPALPASVTAAFQPASVTVHAKGYVYFGTFAYSAVAGLTPKPVTPANGSMTCNGGYSVALQIRQGPSVAGLVRDQYVVQPLLTTTPPAAGTTLRCTSTWGVYDTSNALRASGTLTANVVFDATSQPIAFSPSTVTLHATGTNPPITLAYTSAAGYTVKPLAPATGGLDCGSGYLVTTQLRAGPTAQGQVREQFVVVPSSIAPPAGTTLSCSSKWGLYDATSALVAAATLNATLEY